MAEPLRKKYERLRYQGPDPDPGFPDLNSLSIKAIFFVCVFHALKSVQIYNNKTLNIENIGKLPSLFEL